MWLLGGVQGKDSPGIHDWNNILSCLNLLEDVYTLAIKVMIKAIALMGGVILLGRRSFKSHASFEDNCLIICI